MWMAETAIAPYLYYTDWSLGLINIPLQAKTTHSGCSSGSKVLSSCVRSYSLAGTTKETLPLLSTQPRVN